jgi:hypothetical protein
MARRDQRFRKRDSDRSGFTHKEIELVKDKGKLVHPIEFDAPPPSDESLGGEGEASHGFTRNVSDNTIATVEAADENKLAVQVVTAAGGITTDERSYKSGEPLGFHQIQAAGAEATTDITADPQISAGRQSERMLVECVSNNIVLQDGNGLDLRAQFNMDSGAMINLIYNSGNTVWVETSRSHRTKNLGEF